METRAAAVEAEPEAEASGFRMGLMADRLGLLLRFAQNQVFRDLSQAFAPFDITPLLFSILVLIEANPRCRQADLGAALTVKQPNLVQRIDVLVARGLVSRTQDPTDRRANTLALTAGGRRLLAQLKAIDDQVCQGFVDRVGGRDHAVLIDLLKRLAKGDCDPA